MRACVGVPKIIPHKINWEIDNIHHTNAYTITPSLRVYALGKTVVKVAPKIGWKIYYTGELCLQNLDVILWVPKNHIQSNVDFT